MKLGKLQRAHHTLRGHFDPAYLSGSIKHRAYLFFIYGYNALLFANLPVLRRTLTELSESLK